MECVWERAGRKGTCTCTSQEGYCQDKWWEYQTETEAIEMKKQEEKRDLLEEMVLQKG